MVEKTDSGRMAEATKQAIPSPEDRVRAIREKLENVRSGRWHKTLWTESALEDVAYLLSLVEELKGQVVSASPQPMCPKCRSEAKVISSDERWDGQIVVECHKKHRYEFQPDAFTFNEMAQFFAPEAALLRKRKDYHAEYVEAVEAAEKAERELGVMRDALRTAMECLDPEKEVALIESGEFEKWGALTPEPASQAAEEKP